MYFFIKKQLFDSQNAFLQSDPDQDQLSEINWIMVHQMNKIRDILLDVNYLLEIPDLG